MANVEHAAEAVSKKSGFLWDFGGQLFFEAIGEACWVVVFALCVVAMIAVIYRAWFCSERYRTEATSQ